MRILIAAVLLAGCACGPASEAGEVPQYGYEVVHTYPHDPGAFTQGLFYLNGFLYEGTGLPGESSIRKVRLETGEVLQKRDVPDPYFGEGIIAWKDRLLELTWQAQAGFVYDLDSFAPRGQRDGTSQERATPVPRSGVAGHEPAKISPHRRLARSLAKAEAPARASSDRASAKPGRPRAGSLSEEDF